jgi:hypothetical protein
MKMKCPALSSTIIKTKNYDFVQISGIFYYYGRVQGGHTAITIVGYEISLQLKMIGGW